MADPSNSPLLTASLIRGGVQGEPSFFSTCLRHQPSLSPILPVFFSAIPAMDEIAPEYDVVVLGTGLLLPRHSTAPNTDLPPQA